MKCLPFVNLPDGPEWTYEIKLDGFRLEAVRTDGKVTLHSQRGNMLNQKFPYIAAALGGIPDGTIIDGELVALDEEGRSVFNLLQNYRSAESQIHFYAFDLLVHKGEDLTSLPLSERRKRLEKILSADDHIGLSVVSNKSDEMLAFVREHGLEGVVAKRRDSIYQRGKRSGLWAKHRINLGQEFVIGGYTLGSNGFDAIIIGFYRGNDLIYAGRVRAGFVTASRREIFAQIKDLKTTICPFSNLLRRPQGVGARAYGRKDEGVRLAQTQHCRTGRFP